jgi:hypothetical protein
MAEFFDRRADVIGDLILAGDIGRDGERVGRGRQIRHRGFEIGRLAVDRNDTRAAFGQQLSGGAADDAGSPGDDGDLAIETNSIGHVLRFPLARPVVSGFSWVRREGRANHHRLNYFICRSG